jgi:hypothetical protein
MVATVTALPTPRLRPTTPPPGHRPPSPRLRSIEGGRSAARLAARARYRRRRLVALVAATLLVAAATSLANAAVAGIAGDGSSAPVAGASSPGSAAASGAADPAAVAPRVHVVQPGDTLWSVAAATAPDLDVRVAVDRLVELNGRAPLVVGQRLLLP